MSQRRFRLRPTHLVLFFLSLAGVVVLTVTASDDSRDRSFGVGRQVSTDFTVIKDQGSGSSIAVHAAGQGNPWINLSDGRNLPAGYTGPADLTQILDQNLARPLVLASGDFDEDGVSDLIGGYTGPGGGIITLHRGNVDSIYPNAPEAQQRKTNGTYTDSPFLSTVHVFEVPEAPDFIGTGDFDADSHWDVVAAARGGNALWLLPGDGQGNFGVARRIDLPGRVTTLVTGEIGRADGLTDLVVGVVAVDGPKALIFQSPEGAVLGVPEALGLPAEATALALGHLDGDHTMDLAVGAGSELIVVFGRDGTLSLDEIGQAEAPDANIGQHSFPFAIRSAVIGDFTGDHQIGLSLLLEDGAVYLLSGSNETGPEKAGGNRVGEWKSELVVRGPWPQGAQLVLARLSSTPVDNLVIADSTNHKLHVIFNNADPRYEGSSTQIVSLDVEGEPLAVLPMRLNADAVSDLLILKEGQSAPISMTSGPLAVFTVTNTNESGTGSLRQAILDANGQAGLDTIAFNILPAGLKTITPLTSLPTITDAVTLDATTQPGFAGNPIIQLNGISMQPGPSGLSINGGNSVVRGLAIYLFNLHGIQLTTNGGNVIEGNHLGTPASGISDLGNNRDGVSVNSANNTIGGTAAAARNIISGNEGDGVQIRLRGATGNLVQGNYIGTDISGTDDLGNTLWGVDIREAAANNTIGGTVAGARNIISGNDQAGILIIGFGGGVTGNRVQGNFIGTDVTGAADLGNAQGGISITFGASSTTIGGTTSGARNTIAFNGRDGVFIEPDCVNNPILSNSIHSNTGLGIDLAPDGANANDACDADAGANNRQNFPVLTSASTTSIQGTLNSTANTTFTIQFFASSSCGQGETFVGSTSVTTNANCSASFTFQTSLTPGHFITATATDPTNNTSEFSACRVVTGSSLQFSSATFSAGEAAGPTLITVTRSGDSGGAASVQFSTAAGGTATGGASCTAGVDYVSTSGTLNWASGDATNKTFPITICNDTIFEGNETVNLALSNATGATLGTPRTATLTITDNDAQPTISITDVTQTEGNSGTTNFGFTVSLSNPTTQTVTVNYATANGTATAGADYQAISVTTLTFNPGVTSQPVSVLVFGDTLDEDNETLLVNLSSPANATIADNQGLGTINDDDPLPNLSISDVSQVEGNNGTASFNFTVSLSVVSGRTVTVNYATADGTGTAGSDYQGIGVTALTFTPGQTSKTITVLVNGDTANELDETFLVNLSGATNANISDSQGQGTILNDDGAPTLSINDASVTEGNSGTVNAAFTVSLSPASGQTVTVNYATANGTATAGGDYQAISVMTLTFDPGITSLPVNVLVNGDTLNEDNETFLVNLSSPTNATIADNQGVGTITDDDPLPNLTISDVSQDEGNSGTTNFNFTVSLSAASGRTVTVNYATADGTGTAGSDYQGIGVTALTFTPGQISKTVTVLVNGDTANEPDETFQVHLSGATNANLTDGQGQGTILNDDALPTLSINDLSVTEGNSGTVSAVFTVSLSPASGRTVTVNYATANGTATAGGDYQAAFNALTFNPGETSKPVTVLVIGDTLNESNETFFVNLTNAANATMADGQGVGTITNDDPVPTGNLTISGRILDDSGVSISGLLVILGGAESGSTITDSNGNYSFPNLSAGNYTVTPSSGNYSFSPTNYSFNNLTVDRIGNFVGTQTVVSITGRVTDSNDIGLGSVTLGLSKNGTPEGTVSTDNLGNYSFGNLTAGANYVVTPVGSFTPSILFFNELSVNATANFTAVPSIPPTSAAISGRAADANNNPLENITVTLSGPITRVTSTDGAGNYSFANLAPGGNYAVTIQNNYFVFSASRADFLNLSGSQTFDFKAAPVAVPSPRPPPSDDFDGPERDPNNWNLGTLTLPSAAFDPQVSVAQINGELVITPLSQVSGLHHNGYVSAHSFDLSGGSVSVELVQAATGGANTIFAIGSDVDNFYRFIVNTAGPEPAPALNGREKIGIKKPRDTVAQLLFQVNVGGQLTALSIPYDPVAHRFMRFRHDAPANAIVFETSPDNIAFTERHRVVLSRSVSALTAELSAGTSSPTNPGTAVFDNFGLVTSTFQFSSGSYMVDEGGASILITVTRAGSTTTTATVDYATADGTALQTTKYINAAGRLTFAPGEPSKTFQVLIIDNAQPEGNQNLDLLLQEPSASGLSAPGRAVLTIIDNDTTVPTSNPLENPTFFVTQHYYDFLNREADAPGLAFWVDQITGCGSDTQCIELRRINVSAAYFLSIEFQETGFLVHRFYNLALNRPNGLPRYLEFFRDTQAIGNGVIVGADGWEALLEANRVSYANEFATRAEFTALYPLTLSAIEYVDALYTHAAITPSAAERQAAIDEFSTPAGARGRVLRRIAESQTLSAREFNRAFVLAQYFGYLRRNPDDAPDNNLDGYNFWLNKLNEFNGNFVNAEMVKAFITSGEYRQRFGP